MQIAGVRAFCPGSADRSAARRGRCVRRPALQFSPRASSPAAAASSCRGARCSKPKRRATRRALGSACRWARCSKVRVSSLREFVRLRRSRRRGRTDSHQRARTRARRTSLRSVAAGATRHREGDDRRAGRRGWPRTRRALAQRARARSAAEARQRVSGPSTVRGTVRAAGELRRLLSRSRPASTASVHVEAGARSAHRPSAAGRQHRRFGRGDRAGGRRKAAPALSSRWSSREARARRRRERRPPRPNRRRSISSTRTAAWAHSATCSPPSKRSALSAATRSGETRRCVHAGELRDQQRRAGHRHTLQEEGRLDRARLLHPARVHHADPVHGDRDRNEEQARSARPRGADSDSSTISVAPINLDRRRDQHPERAERNRRGHQRDIPVDAA